MSKCLDCQKDLVQLEGKRKKKFCNDTCRSNYWQKNNRSSEPQYVKYSTFKELKDKFDILTSNKPQQEKENKKVATDTKKEIKAVHVPKNNAQSNNEPLEGSNAFFLRHGVFTYAELKNK